MEERAARFPIPVSRATFPHIVTSLSPAELLMQRKLQEKLYLELDDHKIALRKQNGKFFSETDLHKES